MSTDRPNVVWICADDYALSVCAAYGNAQVRQPNLDRLAAGGLRFDRAFCAAPLSTPSRQAFWTGRYPRSIGVTLSPTPLPPEEVTLPALLRDAGYRTAAFGKTHYYAPRRFEYDDLLDHGDVYAWEATFGPSPLPPGTRTLGPWLPFADPAGVWLNGVNLPAGARDDLPDAFFTDHAVAFLRRPQDRPFFLYVSLDALHSPFRYPVEYAGRHHGRDFDVSEVTPRDRADVPTVFRHLTHAEKQNILAAYHTSAEFLDENVGRVLAALEASPAAARTVVLFSSDHGYMLGQHGLFEKHCLYEEAIRSALLMRVPGVTRPGTPTDALVSLIDVMPTLLELCGAATPVNVQGRSLLPLLRADTPTHREHVFIEYADNAEMAVRSRRWKLIYQANRRRRRDGYAREEMPAGPTLHLFDLEGDPGELNDVAGRPELRPVVEELLTLLVDHVRRTARRPELLPVEDGAALLAAGRLPCGPWRG
jgi:choline-sulfatase